MKKILFAAVAALAMTSCTQNDMDGIDKGRQDGKTAISFNSVVMKNARATATTPENFKSFAVKAYTSTGAWNNAGTFYFEDDITKTTDWAGTKTIYWPASDNVHFFAYAPTGAATYAPASGDLSGYPTLSYTVPATASEQKDLIAACAIDKKKTADAVALGFKHLLTQVNFKVTAPISGLTYSITKIELTGVKNKGTFTYDGTATIGAWTADADAADATYSYLTATASATSKADNEVIPLTGEALMLLPAQTNINIAVTYEVKKDATVILASATKTSTIAAGWAPGKNVLYNITLPTTDLNTIKVTGSISDNWETATETTPTWN